MTGTSYSLYDLANSLPNLQYLEYWSKIETLEDKFSKKLLDFHGVTLCVDAIKGSPFSNMSKISVITFFDGNLNHIPNGAFNIGIEDINDKYVKIRFI